jgi:DNA-binding transcriptional LysR family regulator
MRLSHIDVCNAVLLTGTVTAAARLLNVTQPAVTKLLQSAENQMGFKLFTRDKNRMIPTEEALALQAELFDISSRIQKLRDMAHALTQEQGSLLRVDCVPSLAASLMPRVLKRFTASFPNVTCHLETHAHSAILERMMRRQSDFGFALASIPFPGVVEETLAEGRGVCVAPIGQFASAKGHVTWKDLSRCRLIRMPASTHYGGLMLEASHYTEDVAPGGLTVTTNLLAMKLAEEGVGVAAMDSFTASSADVRKVQVLDIHPLVAVQLKWLRRLDGKLSQPMKAFAQMMADEAQSIERVGAASNKR